jgi:predicted ATPase
MSGQLVGREEELQALELFLASARRESRALVIEGEAGVGKTSLWEAAIHTAAAGGARCLSARPAEAEASFAYAALGDLLRLEREALEALPPRQRHALEVALLLGGDGGEAPDAQSVGLGVLGVVERLAAGGPLVLAVDDVQWLDTPSAAVLSFVARRIREAPVALLLSWRTAGGEPVPLDLDRAAIGDGLQRLVVRPLSLGAVGRLLQDRLGFLPPRPALRRLHDLSGGNPFFALELGRALRDGTLSLEPGERLPVALDELAGARVRALSDDARRALAAAAALTQPTLALVEAVASLNS